MSAADMLAFGFEPLVNFCGPDAEQRWLHKQAHVVVVGNPSSIGELLSKLWVDGYVACCEEMAHRAKHVAQADRMLPREIFMEGGAV